MTLLIGLGALALLIMVAARPSDEVTPLIDEPAEGTLDPEAPNVPTEILDGAPEPAAAMSAQEQAVYYSALNSYDHQAIERAGDEFRERGFEAEGNALLRLAFALQTVPRVQFANYVDEVLTRIADANEAFELPAMISIRRERLVLDSDGRVELEMGETFDIRPELNTYEVFTDEELLDAGVVVPTDSAPVLYDEAA